MKTFKVKSQNWSGTIGQITNSKDIRNIGTRIGGIDVELMKAFLKELPKRKKGETRSIGIYITKKSYGRIKKGQLAPIHCKGVILAPMLTHTKSTADHQDIQEFLEKASEVKNGKHN